MFVSPRTGPQNRPLRMLARVGAVLTLSTALSGCLFETANWSPAESPKRNTVEFLKYKHRVAFGREGAQLSVVERQRLESFLQRVKVGYGDDIHIGVIGRKNTARDSALADRRTEAVMSHVRGMRIAALPMPPGPGIQPWDGSVQVEVGRYIVMGPHCPDWNKRADNDDANKPSSNFGCATSRNLGLMLADPGDLVRTRPLTPSDGDRGSQLVEAYRSGNVKAKTTEKTH